MRIAHIAIWANDPEGLRNFYMHYFGATSSEGYYNHTRDFRSYYLMFGGDCFIELMHSPCLYPSKDDPGKHVKGIAHFAINVGSRERVDELTETLRSDGFRIIGEPRVTGDGFYESMVFDPEGNRIELVG